MNDSEKVFQNLKQDVSAYMELKLELLKLNTYERTGKVIGLRNRNPGPLGVIAAPKGPGFCSYFWL